MTETFTLAHLSDVHLGPITGLDLRHVNAKRMMGLVNWTRGRRRIHQRGIADRIAADVVEQNVDHIAVTGDLANLGLPEEYFNALGWLSTLGDPARVSVVPGNHDIYTGRMGGRASCLETWAPYMRDSDHTIESDPVRFPYVRTFGQVALIGVCSAIETPLFVAAGRVGEAQLSQLARMLERLGDENYIRVVLIHHPPLPGLAPPQRALQDAAALQEVFERCGAELVLHGHNHRQMLAWCPHKGRSIPVLGVSSASAGLTHKTEPLARYHVLSIAHEGGDARIRCELRGLEEPHGAVVSLEKYELRAPEAVSR
jgi:3',5'-cyclic AMP phosphodiesterase CpdA